MGYSFYKRIRVLGCRMKLGAYGRFLTGWKRVTALAGAATLAAAVIAHGATAGSTPAVIRFGGDKAATRIVLDLSQSVQAKLVSGTKGKELVLEFPRLDVAASEGKGQGLVGAYTVTRTATGARLTLALNSEAQVDRRFLLAPAEGVKNYRYVIDIRSSGTVLPTIDSTIRARASIPTTSTERANVRKVIVIDAGHGGRDPGALGEHAREKEITLQAARALKTRLEATGRYRVVMTRSDDTYVPLENRVQISRRASADLFISLHADAGANAQTRGASVYTLSDEGSARVARNVTSNSDWFIDASVPGGTRAVKEILFDLTQRATRNKSGAFAEILIDKVGDNAPLLTRAHRDARYVVLFAPDVPAVLLEMGFITNPADEKLLTNEKERTKIVEAIHASIDEYFAPEVKFAQR